MRDLMNNIHPLPAILPAVVADNTAQVGPVIDRLGYEAVAFAIITGTLADADATFAVLLEESETGAFGGEENAVADADLIGTEALAGFTFADDDESRKLGYKGHKRYLRMTITPANNTGNAPLAAVAILGRPLDRPTANPPV